MKARDLIMLGTPSPRMAMPMLTALTTTLYGATPYLFLQGRGDWAVNPAIAYDGMGIKPDSGAPRTGVMDLITRLRHKSSISSEKLSDKEKEVLIILINAGIAEILPEEGDTVDDVLEKPFKCKLTDFGETYFQRFMEPQINLGQISALWSGGRDTIWR